MICAPGPRILLLFICCLITKDALPAHGSAISGAKVRAKRQVTSGSSILTVEWEGIHSGLKDDSVIAGFLVEYRPEGDNTWIQHDGIIPYKGPNYQYRVRIKDLPSGMLYYVRILVIGQDREVLVKTPEIRAQSETVSISCDGEISEPRSARVDASGQNSLNVRWEPPECGNVNEYEIEVFGRSPYAYFDLQRKTTPSTSLTIGNLLPGTLYQIRIRAIDANSQRRGPWTESWLEGSTAGSPPSVSSDIQAVYRSDQQIRVEWQPYTEAGLQHYEVMILERMREGEGVQIYRARVPPTQTFYVFNELKPTTEYVIGVIAFAEHTPRQVYKAEVNTAAFGYKRWAVKPSVETEANGKFTVQFQRPSQFVNQNLQGFVIEYRLPDETIWRRYGEQIPFDQSQDQYEVTIEGLPDNVFYSVRVYVVNQAGELVAQTAEFNVGRGADASCVGDAGVPQRVEAINVAENSITFKWTRPNCDDSYGPIEGYEYLFWDFDSETRPRVPSHVSRTQVSVDSQPAKRYAFQVRSRSRGGQSPWSDLYKVNSVAPDAKDDGNIYNLRIILAPPMSYLVWTPLKEHQGRIDRFKLKYKISSDDRADWTVIEDRPQRFTCPEGIGNPGDHCHDLAGLEWGVQYTSEVIYRLDTGQWSEKGNPLFFIQFRADPPDGPSAPNRLTIVPRTATAMDVSWLPPLSAVRVDSYKITARVLSSRDPSARPGSEVGRSLPGNVYSHVLSELHPNTVYNVSVQAGTEQGVLGPAAWEVVTSGGSGPAGGTQINRPDATARGDVVIVRWTVSGEVRDLCCYQIEVRGEEDREWQAKGSLVPQNGDQRSYQEQIRGLQGNKRYNIRVRALDRSRKEVAASDSFALTTSCHSPREPPNDVTIRKEGSRVLVLNWTPPDRSTWGCAQVSYLIEGTQNGRPVRYEVSADPRGYRVEYRIDTSPGTEWRLFVRTVTTGGQSRPSHEVAIRTEAEVALPWAPLTRSRRDNEVVLSVEHTIDCDEECMSERRSASGYIQAQISNQKGALVTEPQVQARGSDLFVTWRSQGRGTNVYGYKVQYRSPRTRWADAGSIIQYQGDNRDYSSTLSGLQIGETYTVRVLVLDRSQNEVYTSKEAAARTQCDTPTQPPVNVGLTSPDPSNVRVDWTVPPVTTWRCNDVTVELEVVEPRRGIPVQRFSSRQTTHVFDSQPNEQWSVRMRTVNSAGASPWSRAAGVRVPLAAELIIGPSVIRRGTTQTLTWRSIDGVDDLVKYYVVEYKPESERTWRQLPGGRLPYAGSQRPYTVDLSGLPQGQSSSVRVKVIDSNNGEAFVSREVRVQTQAPCQAPTRAPILQVSAAGPTRVRATWTPLIQSEWNCDQIWYILKYSAPSIQGTKNYTSRDSYAVFDTEPYTEWIFQIRAQNPSGSSRWSEMQTVRTPSTSAGPVTELRVQPSGANALNVRWRQPTDPNGVIVGYEITYQLLSRGMCEDSVERPVTVTSQGRSPYYVIEGLSPHSRYKVTVAAKTNTIGKPTSVDDATTAADVPTGPPRSLQAQGVTSSRVSLTWQSPACVHTNGEITEYEYELKGLDSWARHEKKQRSTTDARAIVEGLTPFTRYSVRVRAFTSKGPGPWTSDVVVTTKGADTPPPPPVLKVIQTETDSVRLMWQEPFPPHGVIDTYKIDSSLGGVGQWETNEIRVDSAYGSKCSSADTRTMVQYSIPSQATVYCSVVKGLNPEQLYDFRVAARLEKQRRYGEWSSTVSARTAGGPVQVLSIEKLGGTETSLEINWAVRSADRPRVQGFRIIVSPVDNPLQVQQYTVDGQTYQYTLEGLNANTLYNVTVQARTASGYHSGKDVSMRTDNDVVPAMKVSPRITDQTANSISLEWNAPLESTAVLSYVVEYRLTPDGAWSRLDDEVPHQQGQRFFQSSIVDLTPNTAIEVRVRAKGRQGRLGEPSQPSPARTKCSTPALPPQGVRPDAQQNQVRVTWTRPGKTSWNCDHIEYELWYKIEGQQGRTVQISSEESQYSLDSKPHTTWAIKMRTTNQKGASDWSSTTTITTPEGAPGKVRNLVITPMSANELRVTWLEPLQKEGVIVGYDVIYRLKYRLACPDEEPRDVSRDWITRYNVKNLEYTIPGLLPFSEYEVRVRARTTDLGPEETKTGATFQTPPSAPPLNLEMTYALERSLSFGWEEVECSQRHGHIVNYEYEILGLDAWAKLDRQMGNTSDTVIDITGLVPFTKYVIRLKAFNSVGGGPNTENLETMTQKAVRPLKPQDLVVMQEGTNFFVVSWIPPYPPYGPLDQYKVRYRQLGMGGEPQWVVHEMHESDPRLACPAAQFSARMCFNITDQEPGQQFHVQAAARIEGGEYGDWSQVVVANTLEILPDAPISISLIDKTDTMLHIGWEPPRDMTERISQYKVTVEPMDIEGDAKTFVVNAPQTEYEIQDLEPDTAYNVTVQAGTKRGYGPGVWSRFTTDPFNVPVIGTRPILTVDGAHQLNVEWSGVFDRKDRIDGYLIEYRRASDPDWQEYGDVVKHVGVKRTYNEKMKNLEPDTIYIVQIKVVDNKGALSDPSPKAEARTGCDAPKSPPTNIRLTTPSPRQVRINWQAPPAYTWLCSDITYRIEYRNGTLGTIETVPVDGSINEHTFDSTPHTKWTIRVRTENEQGESEWSDPVEIQTPPGKPGPVKNIDGKPVGPNKIKVTWEPPDDPNGEIKEYILTYQLKSKGSCAVPPGQPITKIVHSEKQTIDNLEPASTYEVTVKARTDGPQGQDGEPSQPILVTTEESQPEGAPLHLETRSVTQTTAAFEWDDPECEKQNGEITGYQFEMESLDEWVSNGWPKTGSVPRENYDATELVPFTRYQYRVRATNSKGSGPFTEWIEVQTKGDRPPAPRGVRKEEAYPTAIAISFLPPHPQHGITDEYRVRYTSVDKVNWVMERKSPDELRCSDDALRDRLCYRIEGLYPRTEYKIQVQAHNEGTDWGPYSEPELIAGTVEEVIPVLERKPTVTDIEPESVVVTWDGLADVRQYKTVAGYQLKYSTGDGNWIQWNDLIPVKQSSYATHREKVTGLTPDTVYYFRIHVATKSGDEGQPGPEERAKTACGAPLRPPQNVNLSSSSFNILKVTWDPPSKASWQCGQVAFVIKYRNSTSSGSIDVDPSFGNEYEFTTEPGTRWAVEMRTQAIEDGDQKGRASEWSPEQVFITKGLPDDIYLHLQQRGPKQIVVTWDLPMKGKEWNYGVDVEYRLKQKGSCDESQTAPEKMFGVEERSIVLKDLEPWSVYEVTVTPNTPSHLQNAGLDPPKATKEIRTGELAPSGPPTNVQVEDRTRESLNYAWEPPICEDQRGEITQYEYRVTGLDDWALTMMRQAVTVRKRAHVGDLMRGTRYRMVVRAYTSVGPGPWSEPLDIRTEGSELGAPRELHTVSTKDVEATLTWLPPYPLVSSVKGYKLSYKDRADLGEPTEVILSTDDLECSGKHLGGVITHENLCYTLTGLKPTTTYQVSVQAQAESGNWGDWATDHYFTTRDGPDIKPGGVLEMLSHGAHDIKVRWKPPGMLDRDIKYYLVGISMASDRPQYIPKSNVSVDQTEMHFKDLEENTGYNITVEGGSEGDKVWFISKVFYTTGGSGSGLLEWLSAPTNLRLIDKSDTMLYVTWDPPEILLPAYAELLTKYKVTIAKFDPATASVGPAKIFSVPVPGNKIKFQDLDPETIYKITVQGGTNNGYGQILWGVYSTLAPPGRPHILKLRYRTPTSLHMEWTPVWGSGGYTLRAQPLYTEYRLGDLNKIVVEDVEPGRTDHKIRGLDPSTIYNVTLIPKDKAGGAWGAYATLPPGSFVVKNARVCLETDYATSMSWEPVDDETATHYRVRYTKAGTNDWVELVQKSRYDLRCPGDDCKKLCYLIYNYKTRDEKFIIQVQAFVEGSWNSWKTVVNVPSGESEADKKKCCIVPPDYYLDTVGDPGTTWEVTIRPVPNDTHVVRYYVFVDERDPPGFVNESLLTDKLTAKRNGIPYYVAGAFDKRTLPRERKFPIGDGEVYGGYLNYPLVEGKKYNWGFVTKWMIDGRPWWGMLQEKDVVVAGWPWWWIILLLLLLLLLIFLCCCLLWCLASRYRRRYARSRVVVNGQYGQSPLLAEQDKEKYEMAANLKALESRIDNIRTQIDTKGGAAGAGSRDGDLDSDSGESARGRRHRRRGRGYGGGDRHDNYYHNYRYISKGDFEDGYVRGFKDASKVGSASEAKQRMEGEYSGMHGDFHGGYVQGLRDAGMQGMSTSMHNLAAGQKSGSGYSAGYMQGFRDGGSGIFGDRITTTLLKRLEEQYPSQDDFRQGYIEGFKEGAQGRTGDTLRGAGDSRYQESVTQLNERLQTLEKAKGDEIHSTKIYHVYNQMPDGAGYQAAGQQLAQELEEMSSSSRRSTLRRHYTPGDYMKYASDTEGYGTNLRGTRRSLSASALAREDFSPTSTAPPTTPRHRYTSGGTGSRGHLNYGDSYSRRYNYRSRSDLGTDTLNRRYASQTLLDGSRPGPTTPGHRRDALETLQRELETISKSPNGRYSTTGRSGTDLARGYASDTGYMNDTWRSGRSGRSRDEQSAYDYDAYSSQRSARTSVETRGNVVPVHAHRQPIPPKPPSTLLSSPTTTSQETAATSSQATSSLAQAYNLVGIPASAGGQGQHVVHGDSSGSERQGKHGHNWPEELMDIVQEPMPQTLDRMKKYSNSLGQVHPGSPKEAEPLLGAGDVKESVSESYSASYKQEYTVGR